MKLSQVLKRLMKENALSFKKLSEESGVNESTLKAWSKGSSPRSLDEVKAVAAYLGVSFEHMCFGEDSGEPSSLEEILTEPVYDGWLKVKIERAIPTGRKKGQ